MKKHELFTSENVTRREIYSHHPHKGSHWFPALRKSVFHWSQSQSSLQERNRRDHDVYWQSYFCINGNHCLVKYLWHTLAADEATHIRISELSSDDSLELLKAGLVPSSTTATQENGNLIWTQLCFDTRLVVKELLLSLEIVTELILYKKVAHNFPLSSVIVSYLGLVKSVLLPNCKYTHISSKFGTLIIW